jgi:hypothetical protein
MSLKVDMISRSTDCPPRPETAANPGSKTLAYYASGTAFEERCEISGYFDDFVTRMIRRKSLAQPVRDPKLIPLWQQKGFRQVSWARISVICVAKGYVDSVASSELFVR